MVTIKGQKTTNEIASEFGVHFSQVTRWKREALESLPDFFGSKKDTTIKGMESERDHLFHK